MSKRVKELQKQREWRSGHWLSEKPEWDECHGAAEDAWLARGDIAAERERELVEALRNLRLCIMETRGPNAHNAVAAADELLAKHKSPNRG